MKVWIEYQRVIALIGVVTIHSTGMVFNGFGNIDPIDWWFANILDTFSRFAVPLFVMISGCVLLGRNIGVKEFYKKRGIRLIPAFLFWSFIYIIFNYVFNYKDLNIIFILRDFVLKLIVSGKTTVHLWYLSMFICLMIFVPFINNYIIAKKPTSEDYFYMFLAFASFLSLNQISSIGREVFDANMSWFKVFPWYIPYFIMGYVIDAYNDKILISNRIAILILFCILTISLLFDYIYASNFNNVKSHLILSNTGILKFIVTLFIFYLFANNRNKFSSNSFVATVSTMSFGIYLIHPMFIRIFHRYITSHLENPMITIVLLISMTFLFSLLTISALTRLKWFRMLC
jgi:surface polysaccharide O-acyltransferase-like enzyme